MPIEFAQLREAQPPLDDCPSCQTSPFEPFLRGMIHRRKRAWLVGPRRDYCAVICSACKEIVGWESPP